MGCEASSAAALVSGRAEGGVWSVEMGSHVVSGNPILWGLLDGVQIHANS